MSTKMSKTRGKKYRKAQRHKNRRMEEKTQGHIDSVRCITWRHRYKIRAMVPLGEYTELDAVSRSLCHNCSEMDSYKETHRVWYTITYKH